MKTNAGVLGPLFAALVLCGCGSDETEMQADEVPAEIASPQTEPAESTERAPSETRPQEEHAAPRERPATPAARAAALRGLDDAARESARRRSPLLREGRRLGRAGDHAESLAAFDDALEIAPGDTTLLCEAGYQALQLEQLERAAALLEPAVGRVMVPRTRGACLYNLGRVREAQNQIGAAREMYRQSLEARPNRAVSRRLEGLGAGETFVAEDPGLPPIVSTLRARGPMPSIEALAGLADCFTAGSLDSLGSPPEPSAAMRELFLIHCEGVDDLMPSEVGVLVARTDEGFLAIWPVTSSDTSDMYGRIEQGEYVETPVSWTPGGVTIRVSGAYDEVDGEAEAYFDCESENASDQDAQERCFDELTEDMGEPHSWSHGYVFRVVDGVLAFEDETDPSDE